jgi:hypothetical protein
MPNDRYDAEREFIARTGPDPNATRAKARAAIDELQDLRLKDTTRSAAIDLVKTVQSYTHPQTSTGCVEPVRSRSHHREIIGKVRK